MMRCVLLLVLVISCSVIDCYLLTAKEYTFPEPKIIHPELTIDIKLIFDKFMTQKYRREQKNKSLEPLLRVGYDIIKNAELLFQDPLLKAKVRLNVKSIKFLKYNHIFEVSEHGGEYLKNFCNWQEEKKIKFHQEYLSVLVTGLDIYYLNDEKEPIGRSTGRTYRNGVCTRNKSCSVIEWDPEMMPYRLAHEIAHSLGIKHDGPPYNQCTSRNGIMSPKLIKSLSWSPCNGHDLAQSIKRGRLDCIQKGKS